MQWSTWNEPQPFLFLVMVERFGAVAEGRVNRNRLIVHGFYFVLKSLYFSFPVCLSRFCLVGCRGFPAG